MKLLMISLAVLVLGGSSVWVANSSVTDPKNMKEVKPEIGEKPAQLEKATFGAGCFWGVEATFRQMPGVWRTLVGYSGGHKDNPTYKEVCADNTGHAEVVQVEYDPTKVKYEDLLQVFWENHNPTTLNRQGPDVGTQYRSAVFYHNEEQKQLAEKSKQELSASGKWSKPIVTEISAAKPFYEAEDYHQQYLEKRGMSSCHN
jgi:peptide-methionine (S)-S-oxide reductase